MARHAFTLLGVMTLIMSVGVFVAFNKKAEAPTQEHEIITDTKAIDHMSLSLTSPAFSNGEIIPSEYTCDGENVSPELRIDNIPEGTKSLVLVMDDPDIPESVQRARGIEKFDHWAVYNIPATTGLIPRGEVVGNVGINSKGERAYTGACPPDREHRYFFRLYALRGTLTFIKTPTLIEIEEAAKGIEIEHTTLMGRYERKGIKTI